MADYVFSRRIAALRGWPFVLILCLFLSLPARRAGAEERSPREEDRELAALIAEALAKNPDLAAARQEAAAARARGSPAGTLPDPMVTVNYGNDGVSPSLGVEPMTRRDGNTPSFS